ncbi:MULTISPECIES: hypothetical protein [unclassified Streptomyces]|uniref:hypothetical protein n=1 Tax=unclassified Streptomyces TaxID=2593676 RepID=UPI00380611A6|nr:hypothetical protein OG282_18385 [Streptomyces sp. NBC_01014]
MSLLMRAPRECASWLWELNDNFTPGLQSAIKAAAQASEVFKNHGLLNPNGLEWDWFVFGLGGTGVHTRLSLAGKSLDDALLVERVLECRPSGFPDAQVGDILVTGTGIWLDSNGNEHLEERLVEMTVSPDSTGLSVEVAVFHDIWSEFDFHGYPHPEIHKHNAPRLTRALLALESSLGEIGQPGDATYFGSAAGYGLQAPDVLDGRGPDLTDLL